MMLGAFGAVCFAAAVVVLNWVVGKFVKKRWPPRWLAISARVGIVVVATAGVLGLLYGFFVEPNWLAVEHVRLESSKLPPGTRPIRIAHISDLHSEAETRLEDRLPEVIFNEHPDLIVYTGDAVNSEEGIAVFNRCMRRIAMVAPTFVIYAGSDPRYLRGGLFRDTGVIEVNRKTETIRVSGIQVYVGGVTDSRRGGIPKKLQAAPPDALKVLLCHYPLNGAEAVAGSDVDLCFAGNTHGGQVRLPFYGSAVGSEGDRKYLAGLFRVDKTWLYVNRGIGMSNASLPVRFGARPEVTLVEISPCK